MDISEIWNFFDYQLVFDEDPDFLIKDIVEKASEYLEPVHIEGIYQAYEFTKQAHAGVKRLSGEPYIVHPLRATQFLMQIKPDMESIQACLMHDIIEDTEITREEIAKEFSPQVAEICEGLVKVSKVRYKGEDRHLETIKKTFLAMAKDLRVIFIKLADRIHNIQTLQFHPEESKRKKIAEETIKIYAPVAKRLGLYQYQLYLENGSFAILYPEEFERILAYLRKYFREGEKYTEKGVKMISMMLENEGITDFEVKGRIKSPYRIFEKLSKKYHETDISSVMDLLAFRVITSNVGDCYMVLGIIHKYYTPLIKKIKDYIAVPKFNGYKSIHTTVLGMFRFPVEIQIRTQDMDEVAEYGVAAHFAYAEKNQATMVSENQGIWIQKLQKIVADYTDTDQKEKFKSELNIEILDKSIFVYTPRGDIKELPIGSSVLDFAFSVHSEIGLKFKNAIVNGQIKPITYILKTWDIININTFKNKYVANKHWLDFLRTPSAKNQLSKYLKNIERDLRLEEIIEQLNIYLKDLGLPLFRSDKDTIHKLWDALEVEKRLLGILDKQETFGSLVREAYPDLLKNVLEKSIIKDVGDQTESLKQELNPLEIKERVIVDGNNYLSYTLCPECKPTPQDKIIAKSSKNGIKIHDLECSGLRTIAFDSLLEAHWETQEAFVYHLQLKIQLKSDELTILDVIQTFAQFNIPLLEMSVNSHQNKLLVVDFTLKFQNPAKVSFLLKDLKKYGTSLSLISKRLF